MEDAPATRQHHHGVQGSHSLWWQPESLHRGGKSRQKWVKISITLKVCTCLFLLRTCIRDKVSLGKKHLWCIRHYIFLSFLDRCPFHLLLLSAWSFGVSSSRVSLMTNLIDWEFRSSTHWCFTLPTCFWPFSVTLILALRCFLPASAWSN